MNPSQQHFQQRQQSAERGRAFLDQLSPPAVGTDPAVWSLPESLPELPDVPQFDYGFLPGVLRPFVQDIAERMQCPPEFPAAVATVMAGSAIGRQVGIRPKQADSWTVLPNLWGVLVGRSGVMKSPAMGDALSPLKRMQSLAFDEFEEQQREFQVTERAYKIKQGVAEKKAIDAYKKGVTDVAGMIRPETSLVEPKLRRYIVNDSTPEAICVTLEGNPNGVLVERDELIGLLRSMDKEGNQEARALYLTAADGDKGFIVDRIMRGSGRKIDALCLSMIGGIQPAVLASYVRETQRAGAGDDGLLQRFGLMVYPDVRGEWQNVDRPPNQEAREAAKALVERLCNLSPEAIGAELDPYGGVPFLRFDGAAYALFVEWLHELEGKLRSGDDHPSISSHLSKYRKLVPALALINHLCEGGVGPVTKESLSRALLFSEFLERHARRVYSYASRPDIEAAKLILSKLRSGKLETEFNARDVYRPGWSGLTTADEAHAAIRVLEEYGYVRKQAADVTNGRPPKAYEAHPSIKGAA